MAYDLEEQEQLAQFKAWWEKYGNFVLTVVTVVLLAVAGINGWKLYQNQQSTQAARIYDELQRAVEARDTAKAKDLSERLLKDYSGSIYGAITALQAARINADLGDVAKAKEQLTWVIDRSGYDELGLIARLRLAGLQLDAQQYDDALRTLTIDTPGAGAVAFADRRGDVLLAQKKPDDARKAWDEALRAAPADHPLRQLIQLKLDTLPAAAAS